MPVKLITPFSLEAPPHPKHYNVCCKVVCSIVNVSLENDNDYAALVVNSDKGKMEVLGQKTCPNVTSYTTDPTRNIPSMNPSCH
jgi:hypothetical protein